MRNNPIGTTEEIYLEIPTTTEKFVPKNNSDIPTLSYFTSYRKLQNVPTAKNGRKTFNIGGKDEEKLLTKSKTQAMKNKQEILKTKKQLSQGTSIKPIFENIHTSEEKKLPITEKEKVLTTEKQLSQSTSIKPITEKKQLSQGISIKPKPIFENIHTSEEKKLPITEKKQLSQGTSTKPIFENIHTSEEKKLSQGTSGTSTKPIFENIHTSEEKKLPITEKKQEPAASSVVHLTNDAKNILDEINKHLFRISIMEKEAPDYRDTNLLITNRKDRIGLECFLHYLSGNEQFFKQYRNECEGIIAKYTTNNKLDFGKLIELSSEYNPDADGKYCYDLYNFGINLAIMITDREEFQKTDIDTKFRLFENYGAFLKRVLNYFIEFMERYGIVSDQLINKGYNLLYLLNIITHRHANLGREINEIKELYYKMNEMISQNLDILKKINIDKVVPSMNNEEKELLNRAQKIAKEIEMRLSELSKQKEQLERNVNMINNSIGNLSNLINKDIKDIGDKFQFKFKFQQ
jgi:DNA-binding transcriptional MerR regulator